MSQLSLSGEHHRAHILALSKSCTYGTSGLICYQLLQEALTGRQPPADPHDDQPKSHRALQDSEAGLGKEPDSKASGKSSAKQIADKPVSGKQDKAKEPKDKEPKSKPPPAGPSAVAADVKQQTEQGTAQQMHCYGSVLKHGHMCVACNA